MHPLLVPWPQQRVNGFGGRHASSTELTVSEKAMASHSSTLAWRIPGTGDPGGLPSMGSHRVRHDGSDLAVACYIRPRGATPRLR